MNGLAKRLLSSFMTVAMLFGMSTGWLTMPAFAVSDDYRIDESFESDPGWTIEEKMHYHNDFHKIEFYGNTGETGSLETPCVNLLGATDAKLTILYDSDGVSATIYYKYGAGVESVPLGEIQQNTTKELNISLSDHLEELHSDAQIKIVAKGEKDDAVLEIRSIKLMPSYEVTLDPQGGEGVSLSVPATYGSKLPDINVPFREYYTFEGYFAKVNDEWKQYYNETGSGNVWDIAGNGEKVLYARWSVRPSQVTLNWNGGETGSENVEAEYGKEMPGTVTMPTGTGVFFLGYFDDVSGGTLYYNADGSSARVWDKVGPATLYAQWLKEKYNITLDANGGVGGNSGLEATYANALPAQTSLPTRTG